MNKNAIIFGLVFAGLIQAYKITTLRNRIYACQEYQINRLNQQNVVMDLVAEMLDGVIEGE